MSLATIEMEVISRYAVVMVCETRKIKWGLLFSLCPLILALSCSSLSHHPNSLVLDQDASVSRGNGLPTAIKKGEPIELTQGESVLVESPGYVPLLIAGDAAQSGMRHVALKPIRGWLDQEVAKSVAADMTDLLFRVNRIQALISEKKGSEALLSVQELEQNYPLVSYLKFLKVSCLLVLNRQSEARVVLGEALKEYPDNEAGEKLYRSLAGLPTSDGQKSTGAK